MRSFNKGTKFGKKDSGRSEGKSFSKPRGESRFGAGRREAMSERSSGRGRGTGESFEATCDSCGKTTDLPFKPTGAKPVYCRECFNKGNSSSSFDRNERSSSFDRGERSFTRDRVEPRSYEANKEIAKINAKIDKIMKALKIEDN